MLNLGVYLGTIAYKYLFRMAARLAYESNGEWGTRAKEFFKLVCEIAGTEGTRSADCYHWSAMTYGRHWRHRVAVILGRGRVTCLRRSADKGFGGSDVFTAEVAPDSL